MRKISILRSIRVRLSVFGVELSDTAFTCSAKKRMHCVKIGFHRRLPGKSHTVAINILSLGVRPGYSGPITTLAPPFSLPPSGWNEKLQRSVLQGQAGRESAALWWRESDSRQPGALQERWRWE